MSVRETSLEAYRSLEDSGALQDQERKLMRLVHRHYPYPATFTRKELAATTGWTINVITGRVNRLVKIGFLEESKTQTRDGGHLLRVSPPRATTQHTEKPISRHQDGVSPSRNQEGDRLPDETMMHYTDSKGRPFSFIVSGYAKGCEPKEES